MSKKIIKATAILFVLCSANSVVAQVAIGKKELSGHPITITNGSVLLEFGDEAKGIIVPQVASAPGAVEGTFIFNSTDKALEVYEGKNNGNTGGWTDLTTNANTNPVTTGIAHTFINDGIDTIVANGAGTIIGADNTTKPGVLVLESTSRALVLPLVANPHLTIKGAIAGTMVYDTTASMLAVYDGANWSYWK